MRWKRAAALLSSVVCLFVFVTSSGGQLQDSSWPMFRANLQHTGEGDYAWTGEEPYLKWSYETGGYMTGSPVLDENGTTYAGGDDNVFYAISSSGAIKWSYETGGDISSSPAIDISGGIYVGSEDNSIYVLGPGGGLKWSYRTAGAVESSPVIATDGSIYIGSDDDSIYVFTSAAALDWSYRAGDDLRSSPAIDATGQVYIGSFDDRLYAYTSAGALAWSYRTGNDVESYPVVDATGYVYVGSEDSNLYALTSGGAFAWSYAGSVSRNPDHIGVGWNPLLRVAAVNEGAIMDVFWFTRQGDFWHECHYDADGHIEGDPIMLGTSLIVFATNNTVYIIAPVLNQDTDHCVLIEEFGIPGGGRIAAGLNGLVIAVTDQNRIFALANPEL